MKNDLDGEKNNKKMKKNQWRKEREDKVEEKREKL